MSFRVEACDVAYPHLAHNWRSPTTWATCRGIRIEPSTRANLPGARRHVLAELRAIKDQLARKITRWSASSVDLDGDRWVPRRVEDFPENSAEAWAALVRTCRDAIADLNTLQTYAESRGRAVVKFARDRGLTER